METKIKLCNIRITNWRLKSWNGIAFIKQDYIELNFFCAKLTKKVGIEFEYCGEKDVLKYLNKIYYENKGQSPVCKNNEL